MNDSLPMAIPNCVNDLLKERTGGSFVKSTLFFEKVQQFASLQILHDDDYPHIAHCIAIQNLDNVWVIERLQIFSFFENHIDVGKRRIFICLQNFNRRKLPRHDIPGQLHTPETALPQLFDHFKLSKIAV